MLRYYWPLAFNGWTKKWTLVMDLELVIDFRDVDEDQSVGLGIGQPLPDSVEDDGDPLVADDLLQFPVHGLAVRQLAVDRERRQRQQRQQHEERRPQRRRRRH